MNDVDVTILMPCLNEAETIEACIKKASKWLSASGLSGEILIADNGSKDDSKNISIKNGARVIPVQEKGYGAALYAGIINAKGKYIIMGDSDDSYDFSNINNFVDKLEQGYDLVMGNRFSGTIFPGAMPWKNKNIGNPILSFIGKLLFKCPINDFHCGLRGFNREKILSLDLRTTGMEFASEMVIKATIAKLKICEVPTNLYPDGRSRPPHLKPWRDGWHHLRFMLLFCPEALFIYPGLLLLVFSLGFYLPLLWGKIEIAHITLNVHTLIYSEAGVILGFLFGMLGINVRIMGVREGILRENTVTNIITKLPIFELGSTIALFIMGIGFILGLLTISKWSAMNFGSLVGLDSIMRSVSLSTLMILIGGTLLIFSLIAGFLQLPTRRIFEPLEISGETLKLLPSSKISSVVN